MITIQCPACQATLHIPEQYRGATGRCKHCGGRVEVPAASAPAAPITRDRAAHMSIEEIIAEGVRAGMSTDEVAEDLYDHVKLSSREAEEVRELKKRLLDDGKHKLQSINKLVEKRAEELRHERAQVMAKTGMHRFREEQKLDMARAKGATHKVWQCSPEDLDNDICLACEEEGPIPIDEPFQATNTLTPPPQDVVCNCGAAYIKDTGQGEVDEARHQIKVHLEKLTARRARA